MPQATGYNKGQAALLRQDGGEMRVVETAEGNITLNGHDTGVIVVVSGAARTITLPHVSEWPNGEISIFRDGGGVDDLNIQDDGTGMNDAIADNIDIDNGYSVYRNYHGRVIESVASNLT